MKANENLVMVQSKAEDLEYLARLVDENGIKPIIGENLTFCAQNVERGFELLKSRRAVGKIVFNMECVDQTTSHS